MSWVIRLGTVNINPIQFVRIHAPKILLIVSVFFVYLFYTTGRRAMMFPVVGGALAGILGMLIVRKEYPCLNIETTVTPNNVVRTLTRPRLSLSLVLLYIAVILVLYSNNLYSRPTVTYPLHGLAFAYLALNIYYNGSKIYNLLQLFLVSFATYWSTQLLFPLGWSSNFSHGRWGERILQLGYVPDAYSYSTTPIFALHSATIAEITSISTHDAYAFLAVLTVAGTVFVIGSLDRSITSLSTRTVLLAALLFSTASFTLNRGLQPHTTSFFYMHTAFLLLVLFSVVRGRMSKQFVVSGVVVGLAVIFGHTFSAGAPVLIVLSAVPLLLIYHLLRINTKREYTIGLGGLFISTYAILFFSHQLFVGGTYIYSRASSFILNIFRLSSDSGTGTTDTGTTGGFYAEFPAETLFQATLGDLIWFMLLFTGICVLIAKNRYDLDLLTILIVGGFMFLGSGVLLHGSDIPAQRVYQVTIVFGGCLAAGVGLHSIANITPQKFRVLVLCSIVVLFAGFSLASPVASMVLTPLEIPASHSNAFSEAGEDWTMEFADGERFSDNDFAYIGERSVRISHEGKEPGELYVYDYIRANSGIQLESASEFGGAESAFVQTDSKMLSDKVVYDNGKVESLVIK